MAAKKKTPEEQAKSRLMFRARKLARDVHRLAIHGYVTRFEAVEKDEAKLLRAIEGLQDSQRRYLGDDPEFAKVRRDLWLAWRDARHSAMEIRSSMLRAQADALSAAARAPRETDPAFDAYRKELGLVEAKRRARKG